VLSAGVGGVVVREGTGCVVEAFARLIYFSVTLVCQLALSATRTNQSTAGRAATAVLTPVTGDKMLCTTTNQWGFCQSQCKRPERFMMAATRTWLISHVIAWHALRGRSCGELASSMESQPIARRNARLLK
jgi:hypothetical protein